MIDNEYIQKAEKEFEYLTGDEETKRLAELREKAIRDEQAGLKGAHDKGFSEGKLEGKTEGKLEEKKKIAKKLLEKKYDIQTISDLTELSIEEIKEL